MPLSLVLQLICLGIQLPALTWLILSLKTDKDVPGFVAPIAIVLGPVNILIMVFGKAFGF